MKKDIGTTGFMIILTFLVVVSDSPSHSKADRNSSRRSIQELWAELLEREPYPYTVPLLSAPTVLDGIYIKKAKKTSEMVKCRRCPEWAPEPGFWKMKLSKGAYRIIHQMTGWKSIGTFVVAGDRILFANDPSCPDGVGVYSWRLEEGQLKLTVIDDKCAINLRAMNLTEVPWLSCQPPSGEAGITENWPKPEGCNW